MMLREVQSQYKAIAIHSTVSFKPRIITLYRQTAYIQFTPKVIDNYGHKHEI